MQLQIISIKGRKLAEKAQTKDSKINIEEILEDYRLLVRSRQASLIGRREVLSGNGKFGIFGDGKELAQIAMAKVFMKGDFRSGYYRDQTFMMAIGEHTLSQFFAQLYSNTDVEKEPATAGRAMNAHFATRSLNSDGSWKDLTKIGNSASDISPTAAQMPRLVGLTYASRLYRELDDLAKFSKFSKNGNEVAFGTIGNASCAEGIFWESINAIGVLQGPLVLSIWDDEYGISVPNEFQLTKDLSQLLSGFQRDKGKNNGFDIYSVKGWDYLSLLAAYKKAASNARQSHIPAIIHVTELTQPQGHSTSGSHERYKPAERLDWEEEYDCQIKFRDWIISQKIAKGSELDAIENEEKISVEAIRASSWEEFQEPIRAEAREFMDIIEEIAMGANGAENFSSIKDQLLSKKILHRQDIMQAYRRAILALRYSQVPAKENLLAWKRSQDEINLDRFSSHLIGGKEITAVLPEFDDDSPLINGFEILFRGFDLILARDNRVVAFGEDLGYLGDVNQGFAGLQDKYGDFRVSDTGIREATIIGQAIGLALRGLRPIAEIQYLDYLLYAIQTLSDDLATLSWRTKGGQKAPVIVRTRGHRLEGIWHSGSPMGAVIHLLRGMHILVPRNMVQAIGFYNSLLDLDEPGLIVEVLSGYRLKEQLPKNLAEIRVPLGVPEILRSGSDVTLVTYGALVKIALEAADTLSELDIEVEVIDVQTLLPFDTHAIIKDSIQNTNRVLFLDEDVPGGATAYMLQEVIEKQEAFRWLDAVPQTLSAKAHRPAYGSDGNYWSKPNLEDIMYKIYEMMHEAKPDAYPQIF